MMKYILQKKEDKVYSYLLDEAGHAVEIHADSPADGPKLGDIYIGLVQNVARNINAAFVERAQPRDPGRRPAGGTDQQGCIWRQRRVIDNKDRPSRKICSTDTWRDGTGRLQEDTGREARLIEGPGAVI